MVPPLKFTHGPAGCKKEKYSYITPDLKSPLKSNQEKPKMGNQLRTTLLLAAMTALILWIGQIFGGRQGMLIALFIAAAMNFFSYWYSDKIVLRMYRAKPITPPAGTRIICHGNGPDPQGQSAHAHHVSYRQRLPPTLLPPVGIPNTQS